MSDFIVQLKDIELHYNDGPKVFKKVTFNVEKGSFYFLMGPSGSGKSSLLKLLYLGLRPTHGSLRLLGEDLLGMSPSSLSLMRQNLGIVFQECNLLDHIKIIDNVALPLRVRGEGMKPAYSRAEELLNWVGLEDALHVYPPVLSGGQRQRVAIARAIITRPQLLLLDEPTGSVDEDGAIKLLHLFEELNRMGVTVIFATHNQGMVKRFSYPLLMIKEGRICKTSCERA